MIVRRLAIASAVAGLIGLTAILLPQGHLAVRHDPRRFLKTAHDRLRAVGNPRLSETERRNTFRQWIEDMVDLEGAATEIVGTSWTTTLTDRHQEAQALLAAFLTDRYILAVSQITVASLEITAIDEDWPVSLRARGHVTVPGLTPTNIEIQLRKTTRGWRIADVLLQDVSVLRKTIHEIGTPHPLT